MTQEKQPKPSRETSDRRRSDSRGDSRGGSHGGSRGGSRGGGPLGPVAPVSDRPSQIAAEIRRALQSELSRGLNDPRVQGLVSVTEVDLSPDFSSATVQISVLPEDRAPLTLSGLRAAAGFLRRRVSDATRIPRVPRICFELDTRLKRQAALDAAIRGGASAESIALDPASTTDAVQRGRTAVGREDVSGEDSGLGETSSENSRDEG